MAESRLNNQQDTYQGVYPSVFKKIDTNDVSVNTFQVYKSWTFYSGSLTSSALPLNGIYSDINALPALETELTFNDASNIDGSLQSVTYFSINHLFYRWKKEPYKTYGPTNLNKTNKFLYQSASILSIPQIRIGEGIKPRSFSFTGSVNLASDRYGNIYDTSFNTSSIVTGVKWYEGFNEYFDISRINYEYQNITFIPGIPSSNGSQLPIGFAAKFNGSGYLRTTVDGYYDRDHDYSISFFISASNLGTSDQIIATKSSSSLSVTYPFKIYLSGSKQLVFSAASSTTLNAQITSSLILTGSWFHVVCQKSGSDLQMYINNTLESSTTTTFLSTVFSPFTASGRIDNNNDVYIGGFDTQSLNLQGVLDEIRIFNKSLTTNNISSLNNRNEGGTFLQTPNVGNVFDKHGIIVISSPDYRYNSILSSPYTASYRSTVTINELNVITKLDSGDFNMSTNLTLTQDDDNTYYTFVTGSDFAPYITTIGLYDDFGRLLAIGKLAQPVRKRDDVDMNFLIRIDLDKNISLKA